MHLGCWGSMGALSTATWRGYSRWVSLCFNDKDLYDDRVLINKFKRCYGSVGLQAVLLSQNDHDSRWFDWKITSVGLNSAMQRIKLIHILQLQPDWERSCESSDINTTSFSLLHFFFLAGAIWGPIIDYLKLFTQSTIVTAFDDPGLSATPIFFQLWLSEDTRRNL